MHDEPYEDQAGDSSDEPAADAGKVAKGRATFRGLRPVDPNAPWTIHMQPKPDED